MKINDTFENNGKVFRIVGFKFRPIVMPRKIRVIYKCSALHPICQEITVRSPKAKAREAERIRQKKKAPLNQTTIIRMFSLHHRLMCHSPEMVSRRYKQMAIRWENKQRSKHSALHRFM